MTTFWQYIWQETAWKMKQQNELLEEQCAEAIWAQDPEKLDRLIIVFAYVPLEGTPIPPAVASVLEETK